MAGLSSPGIGSGLDINGLVSKLMSVESQPLTKLDTDEAKYQTKISALGTLKGAIASLQSSVATLNDPSKFTAKTVSSSDSSIVSGGANTIASAGTYSMVVTSLAQSQNLSSAGLASTSATLGTGTLTFQFGTWDGAAYTLNPNKGTQSVTIDAAHNTLAGISDAINAANIGVSASIINDGSTNGNRLVLTSKDTGAANEMKIATTSATGSLSGFNFDPAGVRTMTEHTAATDAVLSINGLTVTKPSNTITDAIHGVTLNLLKGTALSPGTATLTVARDDSGTQSAVQSFVKAYNDANKALADASAYDAATKTAAPLQGDLSVLTMQSQLRSMLGRALVSPGGGLTTLTDIGVTFQKDGTLSLDSAKLSAVLADPTKDVSTLFAAVGKTSDALVSVAASTDATKPGSYAINVTSVATQGKLQGSAATATSMTITSGSNDSLGFSVDGVSGSVTLSAGTSYTAVTLAAEVQSRINGSAAMISAGSAVTVSFTATQGKVVGAAGTAASLTITPGSNDTLDFSVDGVASSVTLAAHTYNTPAELAAAVQASINANAAMTAAGKTVTAAFTATQGKAVGSTAANLTILAAPDPLQNDTFTISVDGTASGNIVIPPGIYADAATLATAVQTQINNDPALILAGKSVVVSQSGGILTVTSNGYGGGSAVSLTNVNGLADLFGAPTPTLGTGSMSVTSNSYGAGSSASFSGNAGVNLGSTGSTATAGSGSMLITSNRYGSASNVAISGTAASNLIGGAGTATSGTDVAGTIGGVTATGSGQYLTATGNASGLKLLIDGTAGDRGTVTFSQGFAYQLNTLTTSFLGTSGTFASETDGFNASIKDIGTRRTNLQQRLVDIEARYRLQFNALDGLIASMQSTQSYLTQQLSGLSALANYSVTGGKA